MKRTVSRIKALIALYDFDLLNDKIDDDIIDSLLREENENIEYDKEFYQFLVKNVEKNIKAIDRTISLSLKKYSLDRLSFLDRNLLRIAVCEMFYTNTPKQIIINEILNLSHEYTEIEGFDTSSFNNSVLDSIAKRLSNGK